MDQTSTYNWVITTELKDIVKRFAKLESKQTLSPQLLAEFIKRLVECEVKPGGPYKSGDGTVDYETNLHINNFFQTQDIVLPGLVSFLKRSNDNAKALPDRQKTVLNLRNTESKNADSMYKNVIKSLYSDIKTVPIPAGLVLFDQVKHIVSIDTKNEISLIAYYYGQSLQKQYQPFKKSTYITLGLANIYCWTSYVAYDDFFDDEGELLLLPSANIAMRRSVSLYHQTPGLTSATDITTMFDIMDQANTWELQNCRFDIHSNLIPAITVGILPDYNDLQVLADRAWGHVAGVLLTTDNIADLSHKQKMAVTRMLQHYLIAKQLSDDIHDWKKDLQAGHISYIVAELLKGAKIEPGEHNLATATANLQNYFWQSGFTNTANKILYHTTAAKKYLEETGLFIKNSLFERLIIIIETSIQENLELHQKQRDFLKVYTE